VLKTFGNHTERKCLDASRRFITIQPVAQHAEQGGNLGDPATVFFGFKRISSPHPVGTPRTADG
jgi:hypothetical protein